MLIAVSLMVIIVINMLSLVLGDNFVSAVVNIGIDNEALVDGESSTFQVIGQDILFQIDTSNLIDAGIALLVATLILAAITGITVLGSGLNPQSSKLVVLITAYIGIWAVLSVLAFNLMLQIEIFGSVIYISLTLVYIVGVVQKLSGGS